MIVVIFEVEMNPGRGPDYFALAQSLRQELEGTPGFIAVERFQSLTNPEKYLSVSTWQDEASVKTWRENLEHRQAQAKGKGGIFAGFRIRVADVLRDYTMADRVQ